MSFNSWSPRTAKTCTPVCHGCDEVIDQTLGEYVPSSRSELQKSNSACPKHARLDSGSQQQYSMLFNRYRQKSLHLLDLGGAGRAQSLV
ncbi:hypothetical protein TNCV_2639241 [Trichonephila clavipes]|nr:hypothetical protein TNCV_2639241 [Trichonephila clavipes]